MYFLLAKTQDLGAMENAMKMLLVIRVDHAGLPTECALKVEEGEPGQLEYVSTGHKT